MTLLRIEKNAGLPGGIGRYFGTERHLDRVSLYLSWYVELYDFHSYKAIRKLKYLQLFK